MLLIAALLASPFPHCAWWSRAEHRCRDADVEYLGAWDPRPAPAEWSANDYRSPPPDFGTYPTEQAPAQTWSSP
jgi:hypothetical protein